MAVHSSTEEVVFRPVRALSASLAAVRRLEEMVSNGELRPGDRLPPERELAPLLEISRPTLREAMRALRLMGIIESQQGRGTYVAMGAQTGRASEGSFSDPPALGEFEVSQVVEMRAVIESGLARLAATRITTSQVAQFEEILRRMEGIQDKHELLSLDIRLHEIVASASGNMPLVEYLHSMKPVISVARSRTMEIPTVRNRIIQDQKRLLDALKRADATDANDAMWSHLLGVRDSYETSTTWRS